MASRLEKIYKTSGLNRRVGGHKYTDGDTEPILRTENFTVPGGMDRARPSVRVVPVPRSSTAIPVGSPPAGIPDIEAGAPPSGTPELNATPI